MKVLLNVSVGIVVMICVAATHTDANQGTRKLLFHIQLFEINQDGDRRARANSKVEVRRENGDTVLCDDMSDEEGSIKCLIECDPEYLLSKTFQIIFPRHSSYNTPSSQWVRLDYSCILNPKQLEATYVHWLVAYKQIQDQYKMLIADSELLWNFIGSSTPMRELVYHEDVPIATDTAAIKLLYKFSQQSLDLSESYFNLGNRQEAEKFQRQAISAAQGLLIPYQTVFGERQPHIVTGNLEDYEESLANLNHWFGKLEEGWRPGTIRETAALDESPVFRVLPPVQRQKMWDSLHLVQNPLDRQQLQILYDNSSTLVGMTELYATHLR